MPMKTMFERGFQADGFKHASFYDVPGLGHQPPPAEWFERAIDELDALPKKREKKLPATTRATTRARPRGRHVVSPHSGHRPGLARRS